MSVAFLYPGQGAQVPGMLHQLSDRAETTSTLQEAGSWSRRTNA
jgi:malonate decarboxylase epsilon subunit